MDNVDVGDIQQWVSSPVFGDGGDLLIRIESEVGSHAHGKFHGWKSFQMTLKHDTDKCYQSQRESK